jgi:hypothetical protein
MRFVQIKNFENLVETGARAAHNHNDHLLTQEEYGLNMCAACHYLSLRVWQVFNVLDRVSTTGDT